MRCRPGVPPSTEPPPTGERSLPHVGGKDLSPASLSFRLRYRSLQRMFDARARPRAWNPPPRGAVAPVRVRCATVARRADPPVIPLARAPGGSPSRSPSSGLLDLARVVSACADAAREGREMTPRNHAVCLSSPRPPRGGVAAFAARTACAMARCLGGGREPGALLPRAAWAEHRRVKGTGSGESRPFCGCGSGGIPCSPPRCVYSSTLCRRRPGLSGAGAQDHPPATTEIICSPGSPRRGPDA